MFRKMKKKNAKRMDSYFFFDFSAQFFIEKSLEKDDFSRLFTRYILTEII